MLAGLDVGLPLPERDDPANPPNGSWGIVQIQPTAQGNVMIRRIPPTGVEGLFKSSLLQESET
jgi:hypothetical protein